MERKRAAMECPYCGRAMAMGRVCSKEGFSLEFLEAGTDPMFLSEEDVERTGGVVLSPRRLFRVGSISCPAWHCRDCRKIVLAYGEQG